MEDGKGAGVGIGQFFGDVIGRALANATDSVLKDVGIEARKVDKKIQKARIKIKTIKENPDGEEE